MKKLLIVPAIILCCTVYSQEMKVYKTNGTVQVFNIAEISHLTFAGATGINELKFKMVVNNFYLLKNYPNPFNNATTISYILPDKGMVEVELVDLSGKVIKNFPAAIQEQGEQRLTWNCLTNTGNKAQPGIYFCLVKFNNQLQSNSMVLIK